MKQQRGAVVDVDTMAEFDLHLVDGAARLRGWRLQGLDLRGRSVDLSTLRLSGATFLGCTFDPGVEEEVRRAGAIVFPTLPDLPVDPYRTTLYTPDELYAGLLEGEPYERTPDARGYAWSRLPATPESSLATTLHDHAVDTALAAWCRGRRLVGVMGGHALERGSEGYATAARLGQLLATRHTVATGGGPGAMEAANLGALVPEAAGLADALDRLGRVPSFRPRTDDWARVAFEVVDRVRAVGAGRESLGIPTWFYGHEPPNVFASAVAKYFHNAQREAILLQVCNAGIVFLPGAAGTVQEVFQDACENYYADRSVVAPMVLVGRRYWTEELPVWPLLEALARGRAMAEHVHLVDTVEEAAELLGRD